MAEKYPPPTWPEACEPTLEQLKAWIRTFGPDHDARIAADMIAAMWDQERLARNDARETVAAVDEVLGQLDGPTRAAVYAAVRAARDARRV